MERQPSEFPDPPRQTLPPHMGMNFSKISKQYSFRQASMLQRHFTEKCGRLLKATIRIDSKAKLPNKVDYYQSKRGRPGTLELWATGFLGLRVWGFSRLHGYTLVGRVIAVIAGPRDGEGRYFTVIAHETHGKPHRHEGLERFT